MQHLLLLIMGLTANLSLANNQDFYDCMIDKMKGQPQSMQDIVAKSCRGNFPSDRYETIRRPLFDFGGQYDYIIDRMYWTPITVENDGKSANYILLGYRSLPSAPNLGSVTFQYSFQECSAKSQEWGTPVSVSLRPRDLLELDTESKQILQKKGLPTWVVFSDKENELVAYKVEDIVNCLAFTHVQAQLVN